MTLEELIRKYPQEKNIIGSKYIICVLKEENEILHIRIKSPDKNSDTLDYCLVRNKLIPIKQIIKHAVSKRHSRKIRKSL
jgi:hypothetical protein